MNWKQFAIGLVFAVAVAGLQYAEILPPPYGAIATAFALMLARLAQSPLAPKGDTK